jgi:hypothetical protein
MRKLGAYIGDTVYGHGDTAHAYVEKNTFVWYEIVVCQSPTMLDNVHEVSIWSVKAGYPKCDAWPNGRKPDARYSTTNPQSIDNIIIPIKEVVDNYCIEWENNGPWKIDQCMTRYDYNYDFEHVTVLKVNQFGSNNSCYWEWLDERAMSFLKNATVNRIHKIKMSDKEIPKTIVQSFDDMIKEEFKKSLEKSVLNSTYGIGGFTTNPDPFKVVKMAEKETKTMEKKIMTETDTFLQHINGITITSTYSKLDFGRFGDPYYIYYPKMDITEDMADTLLAVLLMAKRDYIHKVVFNPEKGTTTIHCNHNEPVTVRCKDCEFDYILGYNMARSKMYLGSDDYNWFNKIKNHRKTHIEYTEPKAKKASKKGGKK